MQSRISVAYSIFWSIIAQSISQIISQKWAIFWSMCCNKTHINTLHWWTHYQGWLQPTTHTQMSSHSSSKCSNFDNFWPKFSQNHDDLFKFFIQCLQNGNFKDNEFLEFFIDYWKDTVNYFTPLFVINGQNAQQMIQSGSEIQLNPNFVQINNMLAELYSSYNCY